MKVLTFLLMILFASHLIIASGQSDASADPVVEKIDLSSFNYALTVNGMGCSLCAAAVTQRLNQLDFVESGYNNGETNIIYLSIDDSVQDNAMVAIITTKVEEFGYRFGGMEEFSYSESDLPQENL